MTIKIIEKYLSTGRTRSICIAKKSRADLNGYVCSVYLTPKVVRIEAEPYGYEEAGVYAKAAYSSLNTMIPHIETYLNTPLRKWQSFNLSGEYPEKANQASELSFEQIKAKFLAELPKELDWQISS